MYGTAAGTVTSSAPSGLFVSRAINSRLSICSVPGGASWRESGSVMPDTRGSTART